MSQTQATDIDYKDDVELSAKYDNYIANVERLKPLLNGYVSDHHKIDRLADIIFFVLKSIGNDMTSDYYHSPSPYQSYRKLPSDLFVKRDINFFDKQIFSDVLISFIDFNNTLVIKNQYTYNPYNVSNFSKLDEYMNVIENILI